MKKKFTLVELIIIIAIIGLLSVLVLPNINSMKKEATKTATVSNVRNMQTAVDMYSLRNNGLMPSTEQPQEGIPQPIDYQVLYHKYLRNLPKSNGIKYWVDFKGKVWASSVDAPQNVINNAGSLTWDIVDNAVTYNVYEITDGTTAGAISRKSMKFFNTTSTNSFTNLVSEKQYAVSSVDINGLESPPATVGYKGFTTNNLPISKTSVTQETSVITPIPKIPKIETEQVIAGDGHTLILKSDETLWGFGLNQYGQLGTTINSGTTNPNSTPIKIMDNVKSIAAGNQHTLIIKNDNSLWGFGNNTYGQLGTILNSGTTNPNSTPIKIMDNVKSIAAGGNHTFVIKEDNTLWSFGDNRFGQLGIRANVGTNNPTSIPTKVMDNVKFVSTSSYHTMVITEDNILWGFGNNYHGQLGTTVSNKTNNANPTPIKIVSNIIFVATGGSHTLIINSSNVLFSFGVNNYGQLGTSINNTTLNPNPTPIRIMDNVKIVDAGAESTVVIKSDNTLWSFGLNRYGQLGTTINSGTNIPNSKPIKIMDYITSITTSGTHTLAIKEDKTLLGFGNNNVGQLGLTTNNGTNTPNPTPMEITFN